MKTISKILWSVYIVTILTSCKSRLVQNSTDFTSEFAFTKGIEGPAVDKEGNLYAVNFKEEGTIGKINQKGEGEIFVTLPNGSVGNGIRFDLEGNMYIADYVGHNVYRIKKNTKIPKVWAHNPTMSQPNDLAISPKGTIYLSDPNWAEKTGRLWMIDYSKKIVLLEESMGTVNGIEVSPDGKTLYVNESIQRNIWKYNILENGMISNKTKLISFPDFGMDGMRCDNKGNLYVTRYNKGTVVIISPFGEILKEVLLKGKKPSNITFGGKDGKTCYVTIADRGCFESFPALYEGNYFSQTH